MTCVEHPVETTCHLSLSNILPFPTVIQGCWRLPLPPHPAMLPPCGSQLKCPRLWETFLDHLVQKTIFPLYSFLFSFLFGTSLVNPPLHMFVLFSRREASWEQALSCSCLCSSCRTPSSWSVSVCWMNEWMTSAEICWDFMTGIVPCSGFEESQRNVKMPRGGDQKNIGIKSCLLHFFFF